MSVILGVCLPPVNRNRARAPARDRIHRFFQTEHEHEVASTRLLPTFAARERPMAPRDLPTWFCVSGTKSANEVAQIINQKNNSLKEGSGRRGWIKQNAKSS